MIENLLLCVGAQKAGTTWLNAQLNDHPDIAFSDVKEVHYFNTIHNGSILLTRRKVEHIRRVINNNPHAVEKYFSDISSGVSPDKGMHRLFSPVNDDWYISLFKGCKKHYCADFTPEYALIGIEGYKNVKAVSKNQKIIYMMRDPVDRALSAIRYFYKMHGQDINAKTTEELIGMVKSNLMISMSDYKKTINDLQESFNNKDVLYLFYEDVMANKQASIDHVCDFLNIEKVILDKDRINKRVNATDEFEFSRTIVELAENELSHVYDFMRQNFSYVPSTWREI